MARVHVEKKKTQDVAQSPDSNQTVPSSEVQQKPHHIAYRDFYAVPMPPIDTHSGGDPSSYGHLPPKGTKPRLQVTLDTSEIDSLLAELEHQMKTPEARIESVAEQLRKLRDRATSNDLLGLSTAAQSTEEDDEAMMLQVGGRVRKRKKERTDAA